ncbi:MAG: proline dehydrogenase family protein [Salinivirgaceae bacterium]|nr:proline dehydrogenase family protein [Salinivirgaceae bacterium]
MQKIDFTNTEIAFNDKTNGDLAWAKHLFTIIKSPLMVKTGKHLLNIALTIRFPIGWIVKPTLYRHFVGGETIDKCLPTVEKLSKSKVKSILDYSVEGADSEKAFNAVFDEIVRTIEITAQNPNVEFAVFKPTALVFPDILKKSGFDNVDLSELETKGLDNFISRVDQLCQIAHDRDVKLLIDAEDVWYQQSIDNVVVAMMKKYNGKKPIVWNTWQMYRTDRLQNLDETLQNARNDNYFVGVKFVRGAYMEKERKRAITGKYPSPIHPNKEATDKAYDDGLTLAMENIDICEIFNGTHNENSVQLLVNRIENKKLEPNDSRIWFSQLYGMSDHISYNLAHAGYNVVKYIPYGPVRSVAPYLIRRAEENTSIKGQTNRELSLLLQELKRRKKQL